MAADVDRSTVGQKSPGLPTVAAQTPVDNVREIQSTKTTSDEILPRGATLIEDALGKVPAPIRTLFKPPVIKNESASEYWLLVSIFADAVEPTNAFEWVLLRDYVDQEWDIVRNRRLKTALIGFTRRDAILAVLKNAFGDGKRTADEVQAQAILFLMESKTEDDLLNGISEFIMDPHLCADDLMTRLLGERSKELESLDKAIAHAERRRNAALNKIGKRRESQARMEERLRKASQRFAAEQGHREY
jgi:hypothetical protein